MMVTQRSCGRGVKGNSPFTKSMRHICLVVLDYRTTKLARSEIGDVRILGVQFTIGGPGSEPECVTEPEIEVEIPRLVHDASASKPTEMAGCSFVPPIWTTTRA